jgi:hypothetical protein
MKTSLVTLVLFLSILTIAGCMLGPDIVPSIDVPPNPGLLKGKKIIVSGFVKSYRDVSITRSIEISRMLESARVQDISLIVANHLTSKGIVAEARSGFSPEQLEGEQLLLRGAAISAPLNKTNIPGFLLSCCSLFMVGMILPNPFPMYSGSDFYYRLEVVGPKGRILLQTGDMHAEISYRSHHMFAVAFGGGSRARETSAAIGEEEFLDKIAEKLK